LRARISDKRIVVAGFAALLIVLFAIVAIAQGIGHPSVPSGDVAVVEDVSNGHISQDEFDASLAQAAARQGLKQTPAPSDPQYSVLRDAAMSDVLLTRWVRGEAEDRGISVTDTQVQQQLDQTIKTQFHGQKNFDDFLKQAKFTPEQATARIELQLLSNEIQKQVLPDSPSISDTDVKNFYEANKSQFQQPESRDVRQIVNTDQAKVEQAKALLEKDDSATGWKKAATQFSTDKATQSSGGLRKAVTQGQTTDTSLDQQIFSAPQGQLVGPFRGQAGYYLIEVDKITPAQTVPLDQASDQIRQQLTAGKQQQLGQAFQLDFTDKWMSRTFCGDDYVMNRCANYEAPSIRAPGSAVVTSIAPVAPGQAGLFPGQTPQGLPQGPQQPPSAAPPGGALPIGPGGAPAVPGGTGAPTPTPQPAPGG
jgi:foldase protein PrsA